MIISASRRTDIPAFYSTWLRNRLLARRVLVRNPFNRRQVADISLDPSVTDALVLWTKNPAPLVPYVAEIEAMGFPLFIQYTITGCSQQLEPYLPERAQRIESFRQCAEMLGPGRVHWRFDPIVFTQTLTPAHYLQQFGQLVQLLQGYTTQCTTSFVSLYTKCRRNLRDIALVDPGESAKQELIAKMNAISSRSGIRLQGCCDPFLTAHCGVDQAHCIDAREIGQSLGKNFQVKKDAGQRSGCGCSQSIDIGAYDSCTHGCLYCYANTSHTRATANLAQHDPHSPLLLGTLRGDETLHKRQVHSLQIRQGALFDIDPQK
ncbi:DUF1848 domain-containing protein [Desulfobulbus rhabdoformis]|uniref:DUF1848 domain-containing protein n=1 Tax=Desulfobulbus rhabdoformis TaxID=34032 RepID=UPI001964C59B|nr:DUF1848 domain-containing protein [Desulfobulbus rhabdoformis]MBM9615174.1 DUF1848 domain-containing protein [Desulfobulbus rhabdoformis]